MELLIEIFNILLLLVGSAFLIVILIAIIQVPFKQIKNKRLKKEFVDAFIKLQQEITKAAKEKEEEKNKTNKKTKENK